jgi:hypothetical protein
VVIDAGIVPPIFERPHAVINSSALTATKAKLFVSTADPCIGQILNLLRYEGVLPLFYRGVLA